MDLHPDTHQEIESYFLSRPYSRYIIHSVLGLFSNVSETSYLYTERKKCQLLGFRINIIYRQVPILCYYTFSVLNLIQDVSDLSPGNATSITTILVTINKNWTITV